MMYEYKVIPITPVGYHLKNDHFKELQKWFDEGWEYVDKIQQSGYDYSAVGVVLKKLKEGEGLLPR